MNKNIITKIADNDELSNDQKRNLICTHILKAVYDEQANVIMTANSTLSTNNPDKIAINFADIYSLLITDTGRYTERYASDILIDINSMERDICNNLETVNDNVYMFGIRRDGVDHFDYIKSNMIDYMNNHAYIREYYRKIYAIKINTEFISDRAYVTATLKDITADVAQATWKLQSIRKELSF